MKWIIAIVRAEKLRSVKCGLDDIGSPNMTVTNVLGAGRQRGFHETYRGVSEEINLLKKVRIEIATEDESVARVIDVICKIAKTDGGTIGDGRIFVLDLQKSISVRGS